MAKINTASYRRVDFVPVSRHFLADEVCRKFDWLCCDDLQDYDDFGDDVELLNNLTHADLVGDKSNFQTIQK